MNDAEKQILKDLALFVVDQELSKVLSALESGLPDSAKAIVMGLQPEILPVIQKFLDAKIAAL